MSAPNFYTHYNTKNIYALGIENTEEYDECYYEDTLDYLREEANRNDYDDIDKWEGRDYGIHYFAEKVEEFSFGVIDFRVKVRIGMRNAYYEGANLDYEVGTEMISNWAYSSDDVDEREIYGDICYRYNEGMAKIHAKRIAKKLETLSEKMAEEADDWCKTNCETILSCGGIFSNGEAIYSKVS